MRSLRVLLVVALSGSLLAVGPATPAGAADCFTPYLTAVKNPPPAPSPSNIVIISGGTVSVDTNVVAAYGLAVTNHFANATTAYATCSALDAAAYAAGRVDCVNTSPGVVNLMTSKFPERRYVEVIAGVVHVHYANLIGDAWAVYNCSQVVLPELS